MIITDVRVRLFENKSLKGFADVTLDESLALTGIKIIDSAKGLFVGMPSSLGSDDKYYDIYYPITKEFRETLTDAILDEYDKVKEEAEKGSRKRR